VKRFPFVSYFTNNLRRDFSVGIHVNLQIERIFRIRKLRSELGTGAKRVVSTIECTGIFFLERPLGTAARP
jgi:hypothetical protein